MLKFTYLVNFGLVGALVVPSAIDRGQSTQQLGRALDSTERALDSLSSIQGELGNGDYAAVEAILAATEPSFGSDRERSELLDQLRREIGELERRLQDDERQNVLEHLGEDPTTALDPRNPGEPTRTISVPTTGLSEEQRSGVAQIWPPVLDNGAQAPRKGSGKLTIEEPGYTADPIRQGRAYYRAERYKEALTLLRTREGDPEADYWIGRCYERLDRTRDAIAAYTRVIDAGPESALAQRAEADRGFLQWLIDFDRKVVDHRAAAGSKP